MIAIIDCGTEWLEEIKENVNYFHKEIKVVPLSELTNADFSDCLGIVISGANTMLSEVDLAQYLKPFQFLKTTNLPVLGICLGHQIIGLINGSKLLKLKQRVDKFEEINVIKENKLYGNNIVGYIVPKERSIDIDTPLDWVQAEHMLRKSNTLL